MKKTKKFIEAVVKEVAGEKTLPIVKILLNRNSVSEYELADRLKKDVNQIRNLLYELHKSNLVYSTRKKDKIKGWYIYYWSFDANEINRLFRSIQQRKIERLRKILKREENRAFFICSNKCVRLDFENAMSFNFKCPECGFLMEKDDNTKKIFQIKKEIEQLERKMNKLH